MHTLLPSIKSLDLYNCPEIESFPEGGLPSNLSSLEIWNCSKLTAHRREWNLQRLPSLRHFTLTGEYDGLSFPEDGMEFFPEDRVESFPEEGLLPSTLITLHIGYLSNLKSLNKNGLQLLDSEVIFEQVTLRKAQFSNFHTQYILPHSFHNKIPSINSDRKEKMLPTKRETYDYARYLVLFIDSGNHTNSLSRCNGIHDMQLEFFKISSRSNSITAPWSTATVKQ
ncbi:hypothetical protein TEA_021826 [Camellia sinensis var. sinensis]|uniref:Uncharacterized protein n=1 Tax=Camellia sinensis var. sinensis TaxID=542762 RepID=A0A4V3WN43_CAMSN|nr:hypothetical protein TEA_021826 [Camellia sinensis var. sinensis]